MANWHYTIGRRDNRSRVAHILTHSNQPICGIEIKYEVPGSMVNPPQKDWCKRCIAEQAKRNRKD